MAAAEKSRDENNREDWEERVIASEWKGSI